MVEFVVSALAVLFAAFFIYGMATAHGDRKQAWEMLNTRFGINGSQYVKIDPDQGKYGILKVNNCGFAGSIFVVPAGALFVQTRSATEAFYLLIPLEDISQLSVARDFRSARAEVSRLPGTSVKIKFPWSKSLDRRRTQHWRQNTRRYDG